MLKAMDLRFSLKVKQEVSVNSQYIASKAARLLYVLVIAVLY